MKSLCRSEGKRVVDFMLRKDYDTLREILEEFRQEEKGIRVRMEENSRLIREAQVHLNAFSESEPEDFRYFSPRSAENIHREEALLPRGRHWWGRRMSDASTTCYVSSKTWLHSLPIKGQGTVGGGGTL